MRKTPFAMSFGLAVLSTAAVVSLASANAPSRPAALENRRPRVPGRWRSDGALERAAGG